MVVGEERNLQLLEGFLPCRFTCGDNDRCVLGSYSLIAMGGIMDLHCCLFSLISTYMACKGFALFFCL